MSRGVSGDLVGGHRGSSHSKVLDTLKSRYSCIHEPLPAAATPDDRRYLTSLWVFGNREVDEPESPLPTSFSKLMVDESSIDAQMIKEKITAAFAVLSFREPRVLIQFWSPVAVRKRCFLTTLDQPFGLGVVDEGLYLYRLESEQRVFVVDEEYKEKELGPPGRVYRQKRPEWSLDVHGLSTRQCLQDWAACYNIHGYIDLPVFEPSSGCCVGVLELITSSNYVDYAFEVREVSRALKEENLKAPNVFEDPRFCVGDERRQHELDKIFRALKMVCDIQKLPLAQTWALSGYSSFVINSGSLEKSCSSFNRSCIGKVCLSTAALPFYVRDLSMWGFHEACRERHLEKSQGVVGRSLSSRGSCFCGDVTELGEEEYPLVPIARMNGITSCLAIYLKSVEVDGEYVIELFLPPRGANKADLQSLVETVTQQIKNVSGVQLGIMSPQVIGGVPFNWNLESPPLPKALLTGKGEVPPESENLQLMAENEQNDVDVTFSKKQSEAAYVEHMEEDNVENEPTSAAVAGTSQRMNKMMLNEQDDVDVTFSKKHSEVAYVGHREEDNVENEPSNSAAAGTSQGMNKMMLIEQNDVDVTFSKKESEVAYVGHMEEDNVESEPSKSPFAGTTQSGVPYLEEGTKDFNINSGRTRRKYSDISNEPSRQRKRTDRLISLEEIKKHFGKAMEEAADSLHVSRSTLKRLCRNLGILRWPYSKGPNKSHSLLKSDQTDVVIHASEGGLPPAFGPSNEPSGTTNRTHDPATPTEHGKHSSTSLIQQQEPKNLSNGYAEPKTTIGGKFIKNIVANTVENVMIKATYRDNIVKFPFSLSDGLVKLEELVATRFQLRLGSFSLKYVDEEGDMILIACDSDLMGTLGAFRQPDVKTVIRLLVQPVAHQGPDS